MGSPRTSSTEAGIPKTTTAASMGIAFSRRPRKPRCTPASRAMSRPTCNAAMASTELHRATAVPTTSAATLAWWPSGFEQRLIEEVRHLGGQDHPGAVDHAPQLRRRQPDQAGQADQGHRRREDGQEPVKGETAGAGSDPVLGRPEQSVRDGALPAADSQLSDPDPSGWALAGGRRRVGLGAGAGCRRGDAAQPHPARVRGMPLRPSGSGTIPSTWWIPRPPSSNPLAEAAM